MAKSRRRAPVATSRSWDPLAYVAVLIAGAIAGASASGSVALGCAARPGAVANAAAASPAPGAGPDVNGISATDTIGASRRADGGPVRIDYPVAIAESLAPPASSISYDIDQEILDRAAKFAGTVTITFSNTTGKPLTVLPLVLHANEPRQLGAKITDGAEIEVHRVESVGGPKVKLVSSKGARVDRVDVQLSPALAPGAKVAFDVRYSGKLRRLAADSNNMMSQMLGSLGSASKKAQAADYGLLAVGDGIVTMASAFPTVAPFREGSFDTSVAPRVGDTAYNVPATFRVRTITPAGFRIVTNLVDGIPEALDTGRERTSSQGSAVRDFVLVGARDLEHASRNVGHTRVTSYYRAKDSKVGAEVLDAGASALASFERRFGPYPWPELDLVESTIVGGAGGVEFCAMALIAAMNYRAVDLSALGGLGSMLGGMKGLLGGGAESAGGDAASEALGGQTEFVVAHEVAHQYFAGIVGNDSRRHAVVDEPLAQYAAFLALEDRHHAGPQTADKYVKINYAMLRAAGEADHRADMDSKSFATNMEYGGLVYGKAPFAYFSLRKHLGDEALNAAIRGAVRASAFRFVTTDEWMTALERQSGDGAPLVRATLERYLRESHGDEDLGVGDPAEFVMKTMLPPEAVSAISALGLSPKTLVGMLVNGGLPKSLKGAGKAAPGAAGDFDLAGGLQQLLNGQ